MDKSLKAKAVDIKGKKYVLVSDRVLFFNETYPKGSITTELLSAPDAGTVVVKATIETDGRKFTGHSQAVIGDGYINKTSALENAETSAVGRALALMGIGVIESIASADEMNKAIQYGVSPKPSDPSPKRVWVKKATADIFGHIKSQLKDLGYDPATLKAASELTMKLTELPLNETNIDEIEARLGIKIAELPPKI